MLIDPPRGNKAFTLLEMVMVLVVIGLLLTIIVPKFSAIRREAGYLYMHKTLEGMALAAESYAKAHDGVYPSGMNDLIAAVPPYLSQDLCGTTENGYEFYCFFELDGYTFSAGMIQAPFTSWTITTGVDFYEEPS